MLNYVEGDLFGAVKGQQNIIIAHVVNNQAAMGSGFVIPLMKAFPLLKREYVEWARAENRLGQTLITEQDGLRVSNMCAQILGGERPLHYNKLVHCMEYTGRIATQRGYKIYAPLFGAGLAGGNWEFIEDLVKDVWGDIDTTIFYLPGQKPKNLQIGS